MNKMWLVARQTYWHQIKSWSFVILVLTPFLLVGFSFFGGMFGENSSSDNDQIAVVSQNSQLRANFIRQNKAKVSAAFKTEKSAQKAVKNEKVAGYVIFKLDNGQVQANYHGVSEIDSALKAKIQGYTQTAQSQLNIQKAQLSPKQFNALRQQPRYSEVIEKRQADDKLAKYISFFAMVMMVYMILILYGSITAQEIAAEKGTKIMEIIFSSTTAAKYFVGKILGIFGVILTQVVIYIIGGGIIYKIAQTAQKTAHFFISNEQIINKVLGNLLNVNLVFLVLGVVIYTILAAFSGALVAKPEDSSKAASGVATVAIIAFFLTIMFFQDPEQIFAKILSYVPFFSSFVMPLRVINGHVSMFEVAVSLLVLVVAIVCLTTYISKIYQGVILQTDDTSLWKRLKRGLSYSKA